MLGRVNIVLALTDYMKHALTKPILCTVGFFVIITTYPQTVLHFKLSTVTQLLNSVK